MEEQIFMYVVLPILIFCARIVDVSLGTIRLIFVSKGEKLLSAILGFFEVIIWLLAITRIMDNLSNFVAYIAYGLGFAVGTYVGICAEQKILIGKVIVRIVTSKDSKDLVGTLRRLKYTFTALGVDGPNGEVKSIHVIIHKKDLSKLISCLMEYDKKAYYTVEDVKIVGEYAPEKDSDIVNDQIVLDQKKQEDMSKEN